MRIKSDLRLSEERSSQIPTAPKAIPNTVPPKVIALSVDDGGLKAGSIVNG